MKTTELYDDALVKKTKKKKLIAIVASLAIAGASLAVVLFLLFTLTTANEKSNETAAVAVNAAAGCAALAVWVNAGIPAGRLLAHIAGMKDGERERIAFTEKPVVGDLMTRIPRSIGVYRVTVRDGEQKKILFVEKSRKKLLADLPEKGCFHTVGSYIVAFEGGEEKV